MISLSKRLMAIASLVNEDAKIADIGCDHALLDIYLTQKYPAVEAIAIDITTGALSQAKKNIEKYESKRIGLRLGDGLDVVENSEIDTIIISGLGCYKILNILFKNLDKINNVNNLIIQSNNDYYDIRKRICDKGFFIDTEILIEENGIIYLIISFKKGHKKYNKKDYLFGPVLRIEKSGLFNKLLVSDLKKKEVLFSSIPRKHLIKRIYVKKQIIKMKKQAKLNKIVTG